MEPKKVGPPYLSVKMVVLKNCIVKKFAVLVIVIVCFLACDPIILYVPKT